MRGQPSSVAWLPYGDANSHMLRMAGEILPAVKRTPCIAGSGAHDPALNFDLLFDRILELGFSGVNNEPFCGLYGESFAAQLEQAGIGFSREVELIRRARERDIFTVAWAMNPVSYTHLDVYKRQEDVSHLALSAQSLKLLCATEQAGC